MVGVSAELRTVEAMVLAQTHRGPDDRGIASMGGGHVVLGHNRLSIVDLTQAGHQPMWSGSKQVAIVFNGEVYNHSELRAELSGYPFRSRSDTEVILAAYEEWGLAALDRFIGMFAFALWDERVQELICVRDRLGIKPLQFAHLNGSFLFASEVGALLKAGVSTEPNMQAWSNYLVHGVLDPMDGTFFRQIQNVPPGCYVRVDRHGTAAPPVAYWSLPNRVSADVEQVNENEAAEELRALVYDSVRLRLRADVPVGVNLSGGLDSSVLAATVDRQLRHDGGRLSTFTVIYGDDKYDEIGFADGVPRENSWRRHVHRFSDQDLRANLQAAIRHLEAPFGGVSSMAYLALHKHIKDAGYKVSLEGQGLDELFGGYGYFHAARLLDIERESGFSGVRSEVAATGKEGRSWLAVARRTRRRTDDCPIHYDGTSPVNQQCVSGDLTASSSKPRYPEPFSDALRNMQYRDLRYAKLPRVLRMNDRLSMRSSVELREPFLDHRIVELAFRLPARMKISEGCLKRLPRIAFKDRLPNAILQTRKRFVVSPQREWFRGPLKPLVEDIINDRRFAERGLFDLAAVRSAFGRFCSSEGGNGLFVWQWLNTELWFRTFCDDAAAT